MAEKKKSRSKWPRRFLSADELKQVLAAISAAELRTSGEIRCHMERKIPGRKPALGDPYLRARDLFVQLGMSRTESRNGVLFYLATRSRRFAVLGDEELHERVGEEFWQEVAKHMSARFGENRFGDGLAEGIALVGERLREHFPYRSDDVNELSDDISFGD